MSNRIAAKGGALVLATALGASAAALAESTANTAPPPPATPAATWLTAGRTALNAAQRSAGARTHAKNVILFIGDGMGLSTVTAARILEGQRKGRPGEENRLSFETFPATALAKTYNTDLQVPESSGAMSAIMTGVKTRGASIAVDEVPARGECKEAAGHETPTLLEEAKDAGLEVGVVATARITSAVPAAAYAHVSDRDWEVDTRMPQQALAEGCRDIARQLVEFNHHGGLDVVLGGGRQAFMTRDKVDPIQEQGGVRGDGLDLIARWRAINPSGGFVWSAAQLKDAAAAPAGPLLGLFAPDAMAFEADGLAEAPNQPSLTDMTTAAISVLTRGRKGYLLLVDAGGIDRAHHAGGAYHALSETIELSRAVRAAEAMTRADDTLIIVTADHSHTLTIGGYPRRGNPILGLVVGSDGKPLLDGRGRPYTTLAYANGPGFRSDANSPKGGAPALAADEVSDPGFVQAAAVPLTAETHSGEDVPIYATGPASQWVHGVLEQNVLYWIIRAALLPTSVPRP